MVLIWSKELRKRNIQSWSRTHRWKFFAILSESTFLDKIEKINIFVVLNSEIWTVWKYYSTVLEPQRGNWKIDNFRVSHWGSIVNWWQLRNFKVAKHFCTLNWWFQSTTLESGNWKKLTISECPMEEAMRIGHWVTIQQFHSGKNFLHYELVISSKWKQSGATDGFKISILS